MRWDTDMDMDVDVDMDVDTDMGMDVGGYGDGVEMVTGERQRKLGNRVHALRDKKKMREKETRSRRPTDTRRGLGKASQRKRASRLSKANGRRSRWRFWEGKANLVFKNDEPPQPRQKQMKEKTRRAEIRRRMQTSVWELNAGRGGRNLARLIENGPRLIR